VRLKNIEAIIKERTFMKSRLLALPCLLLGTACATQPVGLIYTNVTNARSYRAATPTEVKSTPQDAGAEGKSCAQGVLGLVAWGDGGYGAAVNAAMAKQSTDKVIYDVKADVESFQILGFLYQELCTRVTGKVGTVAGTQR
jgi:hypothetical protein